MSKKFKEFETTGIGGSLRDKRRALKLTLKYVYENTGINIGHLSKIENGIFKFESGNFVKYCNFLNEFDAKNRSVENPENVVAERARVIAARSIEHLEFINTFLDWLDRAEFKS